MNPSTITMLDLDSIVQVFNPRLPTNLALEEMRDDLAVNGMFEPVHVWKRPDGVLELLKGHRRIGGASLLRADDPKTYSERFPNGIRAIVWDDLTEEEALMLKLDHGNQKPLSDPHELQMSASEMFRKGFTEAQVANHLRPLITTLAPMPPKAKAEVAELEKKLDDAKAKGDDTAMAVAEKELQERIAKLYRGRVQHLHNVARCPDIVDASLFYKACDQKPKGYENEALPKLTTDQVKSLWKAHLEDLKIVDEKTGAPKYNKRVVGPNFTEKWKAILIKEAEAEGDKPARDKAMSAKDMKAEVTEGKWACVGFYKLTKRHSGDKSVEGLETLDREYHALDLVKQYKSSLFEKVVAEGEKIVARLTQEAEAKADAEATDEGQDA